MKFFSIRSYQAMLFSYFFSGGVFVIVVNTIGPKELHRRILRSKPVCVVAALCDQVNSKLLDVVDQVRDRRNLTFLPPGRMPLLHCSMCRVQRLTRDWLTVVEDVGMLVVSFAKATMSEKSS